MRIIYGEKQDLTERARRMLANGVDVRETSKGYEIYYEEQKIIEYRYGAEFEQLEIDWRSL